MRPCNPACNPQNNRQVGCLREKKRILTGKVPRTLNIPVKHLRTLLVLAAVLAFAAAAAIAGEKPSDSEIKAKLLGYWQSPRHACLIKSDGVVYMCPRSICTTTNRWDVKGGLFYWDGSPNEILTLTSKNFAYREVGATGEGCRLKRISKSEAE